MKVSQVQNDIYFMGKNIFFFVLQKKECHTGLDWNDEGEKRMAELSFWVNCLFNVSCHIKHFKYGKCLL